MTVRIYFQNHPVSKHLYGGFCPSFPGIPLVSSGIPPCWDGMKKVLVSYKHSIAFTNQWLYAYHPVYCPVAFFILSRFLYKQLLSQGVKAVIPGCEPYTCCYILDSLSKAGQFHRYNLGRY